MANSVTHSTFEFPIRGARYTLGVPYANPNDEATAFDTKISKDNGALADAAEEITGLTGADWGFITLSGAETDCSLLLVQANCVAGQKPTLFTLRPQSLPIYATGTATAGAGTTITLQSVAHAIPGCLIRTTGGTGGGGTGGANNQVRRIKSVSGAVATIGTSWETNPSSDTTYEILLPENALQDADIFLLRNLSGVEAVAPKDCLLTAILATLHNSLTASPGNLRILRTNGSTTHFDIPVTTDPAAEPLTSVN